MGLMAQFASCAGVMYAVASWWKKGRCVIFRQPEHPYTRILMESLPSLDEKETLQVVKGAPPSAADRPAGCVFHPRCPFVMDRCIQEEPLFREVAPEQWAACHLHDEPAAAHSLSREVAE